MFVRTAVQNIVNILFAALLISGGGQKQAIASVGFGSVTGSVTSDQGVPVVRATVYAFSDAPQAGILPTTYTDSEGRFSFPNLPSGPYHIAAGKRSAGYPDPNQDFVDPDHVWPRVIVRAGEQINGILVKLGAEGAGLKGRVIDARTGRMVPRVAVTFCAPDAGQPYMIFGTRRDGSFDRLVPSNKSFWVRAAAPGYRTWYYGPDGTEQHTVALRMTPGTTKELVISLQPISPSSR